MKTSCGKFLNLAHYFPYDVKLRLLAHSRSFLANQKVRNAIVGAENLLNLFNCIRAILNNVERDLTRFDPMRRVFVSYSQPIRIARFDEKSVNRGLPTLDLAITQRSNGARVRSSPQNFRLTKS